jgi:isoquinoline 1-oxidoreductase alpha subunit
MRRAGTSRIAALIPGAEKPKITRPHREPLGGNGMVAFTLNGKPVSVEADSSTPLLWVLRDMLKLTGTKYGCGAALCGACTVHVNGAAVRSCTTQLSAVAGRRVVTIEGLSPTSSHPLQKAWIAEQVPQCGYCQSGQIMKAAELLAVNPKPTRAQIVSHMNGNICRCGTYHRIAAAIERAAREG